MSQKIDLQNKFDILPESIRNWLESFEATEHVVDLNDSLNISWDKRRIIPKNIARLVTGMISPEAFPSTLKTELGIDEEKARKVSSEIGKKILSPIADALKTTQNIDVRSLIPAPKPEPKPQPNDQANQPVPKPIGPSLDSLAKQNAAQSKQEDNQENAPKKPMSAFASMQQGSLAQQAQVKKQEKTEEAAPNRPDTTEEIEDPKNFKAVNPEAPKNAEPSSKQQVQQAERPFMLHEETPKAPSQEQGVGSDFSFELPMQERAAAKPAKQEKTKVNFGSFFNRVAKEKASQEQIVESKKEVPKVVHYSAFRTMLGDNNEEK